VYLGFTINPASVHLRVELYFLADFVTNCTLCDLLEKKTTEIDLNPSRIMDLLLCFRGRLVPEHLKLRELAIEYFRENRDLIVNEANYPEKLRILFGADEGVDLVKELF
jgi:hypothetical protein